jgi:hypothetical protein
MSLVHSSTTTITKYSQYSASSQCKWTSYLTHCRGAYSSCHHSTAQYAQTFVVQVNVIGKTHGLENYLDNYAQQLKKSRPLRLKVLQHYVLLLNAHTATTTTATVR